MEFKNSKKLYSKAKNLVPGGVSSSIRQTEWPVPLFFEKAHGSKMWDVDGNIFIDYVMGMGPNIFGHAPEFVTQSVYEDMQNGYCLTGQTVKENEMSEFIKKTIPFNNLLLLDITSISLSLIGIKPKCLILLFTSSSSSSLTPRSKTSPALKVSLVSLVRYFVPFLHNPNKFSSSNACLRK